jgi:hypothetical protein
MSQGGIGRWLLQVGGRRVRTRVVADEVEMLASGGGDTEGLFHQTVGLISVAIWALICAVSTIFVATPALW